MRTTATLQRETFSTSRLLEFFSEKELQMQIGFSRDGWAIALLKELIDNALDACEMAGVAPTIEVAIDGDTVSVRDNGPGLPVDTLLRSLDYSIRVSDKSYYVSPSRGQLGNALKCLWAAPYVVTGERGEVEVHANGRAHRITVELDRIAQAPRIGHAETDSIVKTGTFVKFGWPEIACMEDDESRDFYNEALDLLRNYAAFNPHASFRMSAPDEFLDVEWASGDAGFTKWAPHEPTSALWYGLDRFISLIAAYLAKERTGGRALTVREFVSNFRGFAGSAKQKAITDAAGLTGKTLQDLVENGEEVSRRLAASLFVALQTQSQPVKPSKLGAVGRENLSRFLVANASAEPEMIDYKRVEGESDGVPFIVEAAFGVYTDDRLDQRRAEIVGLNWSPCLRSPFEGLTRLLGEARVDAHDPVVFAAHLACPRLAFVDRGKSALQVTDEMRKAFEKCVRAVTKEWKKLKRQADREDKINRRQLAEYHQRMKPKKVTVKDASFQVMKDAYLKAGANGTLPAGARQIMYAARGPVIELTGNPTPWKKSSTFTQGHLIDYMEANPEETRDWDVVFDARGHFLEPHTGRRIDLGTLDVRSYIRQWLDGDAQSEEDITLSRNFATCGTTNRFRFALFVEKEGFNPLFKAVHLTDRYDLALMSTKGMSVTASRLLVDELSKLGVTVLVLRDFDKSGFSIVHTLANDTRRYKFSVKPRVVDLGLRLEDVRALNLESEAVEYKSDPRPKLKESGATDEEVAFLVRGKDGGRWIGERVEINAMPSDVLVAWLEKKLMDVGAAKVVPSGDTLAEAWKQAMRRAKVQAAIDKALDEAKQTDEPMPAGLADRIREAIEGKAESWDAALWQLALGREAV